MSRSPICGDRSNCKRTAKHELREQLDLLSILIHAVHALALFGDALRAVAIEQL